MLPPHAAWARLRDMQQVVAHQPAIAYAVRCLHCMTNSSSRSSCYGKMTRQGSPSPSRCQRISCASGSAVAECVQTRRLMRVTVTDSLATRATGPASNLRASGRAACARMRPVVAASAGCRSPRERQGTSQNGRDYLAHTQVPPQSVTHLTLARVTSCRVYSGWWIAAWAWVVPLYGPYCRMRSPASRIS